MSGLHTARVRVSLFLAFACLFLSGKPLLAQSLSRETPQEVARGFYRTYGRLKVRGVPSEKQRLALSPYLSGGLIQLLAKTQELRDTIYRQVNRPGTPPGQMAHIPGYEGDWLTSNDEHGAKTFALGQVHRHHEITRLSVYLTNEETSWNDELVLRNTASGWAIDDIEFTSDRKNTLYNPYRRTLRQTLKECLKCWPKDRYRGKRGTAATSTTIPQSATSDR